MENLKGKNIAIVVTDGFEDSELNEPLNALKSAGAVTHIISPKEGEIKGWKHGQWVSGVQSEKTFFEANADAYDGLLIPGGALNCDKLRMEKEAVRFVRDFFEQHKPVAAICHGPQMLIEAGVLDGRKLTSYQAIKTDVENAGGHWVDRAVVVDQGLVTSRTPDDLPSFIEKMIEEFAEGNHEGQY